MIGAMWALLAASAAAEPRPSVRPDDPEDVKQTPRRLPAEPPVLPAVPADDDSWRTFGGLSAGAGVSRHPAVLASVPEKTLRRRARKGDAGAEAELHRRWREAHPLP